MPTIAAGQVTQFLIVLVLTVTVVIMLPRVKTGKSVPQIRRLPAVDSIDEAVGRATEMDKPIVFSPGTPERMDEPQTFAALNFLSFVAQKTARYHTRLIVTANQPWLHPILEEVTRQAYMAEGEGDAFRPDDIQFIADDASVYASGVVGIINREKAAVNMLIGAWWGPFLIMAEAAQQAGAIQVAATANTHQLAFLVTACDYCLIGEEMYAASAYMRREPVLVGTLLIQDWAKMALIALVIVGTLMATFGTAEPLVSFLNK